ncbi:MAG: type II secretion system F family protein [Candidatus Methanoperedens sp.]|nr:type II secretion system F family protein [Candidatus Methanoperedens sp.]
MNFSQFSLLKFGNYVKKHEKYLEMRKKLRTAHIFKPYEEYVSEAIVISIIMAIIGSILGGIIGYIIFSTFPIPTLVVYDQRLADFLRIFSPYKIYTTIAIAGSFFLILIGVLTYSVLMIYPSFQASIRKVNIDTQLPHAVMYMYALSRGETNIVEIIRSVADLPNVYGEISKEFSMILRDMEFLGIDFMSALRNVQADTPSRDLNEFLGNLITLIDNGGDITDFFSMQIESYRVKTKRDHTLFLDMLGMIAEGYVTGFVAGPLFLIIVAVTLGSMQGSMTWLLLGMTFVVLPFGSIGFIFLIDLMLPKDEQVIGSLNLRKVKEFAGIRTSEKKYLFSWDEILGNDSKKLIEFLKNDFDIEWINKAVIEKIDDNIIKASYKTSSGENYLLLRINDEKNSVELEIDGVRTDEFIVLLENGKLSIYEMIARAEKPLFEEYKRSKKLLRIKNILKDPLKSFFEEPDLSLIVTIPIAVTVLLFVIFFNTGVLFEGYVEASNFLTNYILLSIFIVLVPYIIFFETRSRKLWKIENSIPQFLQHLSLINETGISLAESLRIMLRTERGPLRKYVEKMYTDITWGSSTVHAFVLFANDVRMNMISRVVALITKASESSGDIRQVLDIAATDTNMNLQLKKDKSVNMLIYLIIIYMAFLVFLYVVYSLTATFLPPMAKGAAAGGGAFIKNFNLDFYKVYFYHTALIQAFFSGVVAGVMGEGNFRSGFKHSLILILISFLLFKFMVQV